MLLTGGLERGVLVEADAQVVVRVRQGHGRTQRRQRRVVQVVVICGRQRECLKKMTKKKSRAGLWLHFCLVFNSTLNFFCRVVQVDCD